MKIACIDIGGTNIKYGVLENGILSGTGETPTRAEEGAQAMLATVARLVQAMPGVCRVGVSTAGEVEPDSGRIRLSNHIAGYTGLNPKTILQQALHLPVAVENDVNAAATGEHRFGAARGTKNFLMVNYGTGVGGAVYIDGQLYRGAHGSAGEFGWLMTHPEAFDPADPGSASYERFASASALVARVAARRPGLTDGREVFAHREEPVVRREIEAWLQEAACGLVSLIHAFDPQCVVLGGGISQEPWLHGALGAAVRPRLKPSFSGCALVPAALGNRAGLMGAGCLAQQL